MAERVKLSEEAEATLSAVAARYDEGDERNAVTQYTRKLLKIKEGLRSTSAPRPANVSRETAEAIREEILGPRPSRAKVEETAAA